jgi:thymidylate kinase
VSAPFSVELVGIPGAGKSHLAAAVAAELRARGIAVTLPQARLAPSVPVARRLARKTVAGAASTLSAPLTTARVVRGVLRSDQPRPSDVVGRVVQWLVAQDLTRRTARQSGVTILDEGLIQALWSIGVRGDVEPVLRVLDSSRRWHEPDLLVVVGVPPDLALARLSERPSQHSRTQRLAEDDRLPELRRGAALLDRLVEWWGASRDVMVMDGAADGPVKSDVLADRIAAAVAAGGSSSE